MVICENLRPIKFLKKENGRGHNGRPAILDDTGLRDIRRAHDLVADAVEFFFLVPALGFVKFDPQRRGQHGRGQILGVIPRFLFGLAEGVVLAEIPVQRFFRRDAATDGGGDQTPGLVAAALGQHAEGDAPGDELAKSLGAGDNLTAGGQDAGDGDQVTLFDAGIAQGQLEGAQFLFVETNAFRKKKFSRDQGFQFKFPFREADSACRGGRAQRYCPKSDR